MGVEQLPIPKHQFPTFVILGDPGVLGVVLSSHFELRTSNFPPGPRVFVVNAVS